VEARNREKPPEKPRDRREIVEIAASFREIAREILAPLRNAPPRHRFDLHNNERTPPCVFV
jgi:hypothetical protein